MNLSEVINESKYEIIGFDDKLDQSLYYKLLNMGLSNGTEIITINSSIKGLVMFYVDNTKICIRSKDAKYIEVGEVNE